FVWLPLCTSSALFFFSFDAPATTEIYTLSLHDALPISAAASAAQTLVVMEATGHYWLNLFAALVAEGYAVAVINPLRSHHFDHRSEEHTSELQSHLNLVCRLLLEKKNKNKTQYTYMKYK